MGLDFIQYCQPIRAKAQIITRLFNDAQRLGSYQQGSQDNAQDELKCVNIDKPKAYNATSAYICASGANNITVPRATLGLFPNSSTEYNQSPAPYYRNNDVPTTILSNANNYRDIVGLLTPVKVSDYMAQNNYSKVTRYYLNMMSDYTQDGCIAVNSSNGVPLDDSARFGDYIVPVITWFYTDSSGARQQLDDVLLLYYIFSARALNYKTYKSGSILGGSYFDYVTKSINITGDGLGYFMFSPPYVHTSTKSIGQFVTSDAFLMSGCVYCKYPTSSTSSQQVYLARHSAPYVSLYPDAMPVTADRFRYALFSADVDGLTSPVGVQIATDTFGSGKQHFPAYKDVQSIIDLFADYGMTITTDLDTSLNPPTTDDGVINPDNPAEPMPFFPDNGSDETPIEGAYITPSNFAQSCVYNPLSTRDFLRWVCDNTVDIGNWSRLFANPVDVITGINLYNLNIPAHDSAHTALQSETNILGVTTTIPNYAILDGYNNIIDGGTLTLEAYYGNYADFTSMTYQCFIPFVGFTSLRASDVVNKTLHLFYAVDFATGAAVAFLNSDNKLIYTSPCTVAGKIPLSTSDKNSQMINNTLSILGSVGGLLGGIASGNVGGGVGALLDGVGGLQMQTNYTNKGSLSAVNIYKLLPAFVERTRYDLFFPSDDQQYKGAKYQSAAGAPSTTFDTLINCANAGGFVQSDVVYITSGTATETEKAEIAALIKSGIYL